MNASGPSISVIDPLTPAVARAKMILFQPFTLEKWLAIGFCAWLATLGESGGGGTNFYTGGGRGKSIQEVIRDAKEWVMQNLNWVVPLAVGVGVIGLVVWLVITWLSSRGRFMFVHSVARNRAEVALPWRTYRSHGDSLFFFRVVLGLLGMIGIIPLAVLGALQLSSMLSRPGPEFMAIAQFLAILAFLVIMGVVFTVVGKMTKDFVVPIMFLESNRCLTAWNQFFTLLSSHLVSFILYLLFQIVLKLAIGLLVILLVVVTCCLAGCLLLIPYVGTVLLLPILVFERSYSLYFLSQFGPRYDVFATQLPAEV